MISKPERRILQQFNLPWAKFSLSDVVRAGLPTKNAVKFIQSTSSAVPFATLLRVAGISQRTLERRTGKRLRPDQSDRLVRIARVIDFAEESIGTRSQALGWMNVPNQGLQGARPIEELDTDAGAKRVETILGRLREGTVA
jgi:putative toxin-antitoxin system antitoxin component (TIGR02293 family)